MRVVQIIGNSVVGGAESHVLDLVEGLAPLGGECVVVCPRPGPLTEALASRGVAVTCLEMVFPRAGDEYAVDWSVVERLAAVLHEHQPAVVHSHLYPAHLHGTLAAHTLGIPAIVHSAHTLVVRPGEVLLGRLTSARTIATSRAAADLLVRAGVPPGRIELIYNGVGHRHFAVDAPAIQRVRRALGLGAGPVIGTVARLSPEKGVDVLLRALPEVVQRYPSLAVLVAGAGPAAAELQGLVQQLGLSNMVHFLGARRDVRVLNCLLDVFVLSSRQEACPMALLEAMAAARAVVATAIGGTPELVTHGVNGWLVPPDTPPAIAKAVIALLENPPQRAALGRAARQTVAAQFTHARMVHQTWSFYQTILATRDAIGVTSQPLAAEWARDSIRKDARPCP